ncbi:MAG: phenylacetate--CoA ligase family protein [Acetobacteraceae bacterium]
MLWALRGRAHLDARDRWTRAELLAHQRVALLGMIRYAATHTRFYRNLYRDIDLSDDLNVDLLPVVSKRQLMESFDTTVTDQRLRLPDLQDRLRNAMGDQLYDGQYRIVGTAGTSGLRGVFVYDRAAWRVVLANTLRWQAMIGITPHLPRRTRIASIGADHPMHVTSRIPMSCDIGLFRMLHVEATEPIAHQVAALNAFQPNALLPYPSVAALLAHEQIAGRLAIHPDAVATHSEMLTPEMVRLITEAWGKAPFNHYGMTEEPHVGSDCSLHAGMHVFEDTCVVEIVDDDYRPVPDGQPGTRWLLTNLYNFVQPLIRYEVTDMLCRSPSLCACGRPFALVTSVGGRAEDMLYLPRRAGAGMVAITPMVITLAIEGFGTAREYSAEHCADRISMRLVVPDATQRAQIERALPDRLRAEIEAHGAVAPRIELTFVDALERSAQRMGKISLVTHSRPELNAVP